MRRHRAVIAVHVWVFLTLVLSGCSQFEPGGRFGPAHRGDQRQTNLYGRLDSWQAVGFSAKPFASLKQHSFSEEGGDFDPDISGDGNWIVYSSLCHAANPDIYIKRTSGFTTTRLTSDTASEIQPSLSPLGDKVAYSSNRAGNWDIWVVGVDGTNSVRLTSSAANEIHPSWSPDGSQLVYCTLGLRSGQWELWVLDVQNPSVKRCVGFGLFPQWCPNADIPKIAFQQARHRGSQWFSIWTIDLVDGEAKFPTEIVSNLNYACICPSWSPTGNQLVYSTVSQATYEKHAPQTVPGTTGEDIWIVDLDGRNNLRLTSGLASNFSPTWSPDGRVFFCSDRAGTENVWSMRPFSVNFTADKPVDLSRHPQNVVLAN